LAAELAELLPGPHENVLRDLVGFVAADHPPRQAVNPPDVRAVEPLEGGRIPPGRQGHVGLSTRPNRGFAAQRHQSRCQRTPTDNCLDGLSLQKGCQIRSAAGRPPPRPNRRLRASVGFHSRRSSKYEYTTGVTRSVSSRQSTWPPRMVTAIEARDPA